MNAGTHFSDWRGLRTALGLTLNEMGQLIGRSLTGYWTLEHRPPNRCQEATIRLLRYALMEPELQARLKRAGYPHPFPDDVRQAQEARQ